MIDNIFDRLIRESLRRFKFMYNPESWNRLEEKLIKSDDEDAIFDALVSDKLKSYSVPVGADSFARFEQEYLSDDSPSRKVYYYPAAVAAVLLLVLLIFMNTGLKHNKNELSNSGKEIEMHNEKVQDLAISDYKINSSENKKSEKAIENNENRKIKSNSKHLKIIALNEYPYNQFPITSDNNAFYGNFGIKYNPYINTVNNNGTLYSRYKKNVLYDNKNIYNNELVGRLKIHIRFVPIESSNTNLKDFAGNTNIPIEEDDLNKYADKKDLQFSPIDSNCLVSNTGMKMAVNGYFSPDINIINTPNDLLLKVPGYVNVDKDFSTGLSFSVKKGKSELETGIEYFRILYSPVKKPVNLHNSIIYLNKIGFDNIAIPVNYKYHIVDNDKWGVYTITGASANMIVKSKYEFVEKINSNGNDYSLKRLAQELQEDIHFKNSLYAKKDYSTGALEGGDIGSNFYLALNAGVGIKRKLSNGFSIYFEPQYKYIFNKFNPNDDIVQKMNFKFGLSKIIKM